MWQAVADSVNSLSASPATVVGQILLRYGISNLAFGTDKSFLYCWFEKTLGNCCVSGLSTLNEVVLEIPSVT